MIIRSALEDNFLIRTGWSQAQRVLIAGDAANRKYERLTDLESGNSVVVMDAPPEKGEDTRPFIEIAKHLLACGLSPPRILHSDVVNGFLLIEDLGDALFSRVLRSDQELEETLYRAATDVLIHLHKQPVPNVATYDAPKMRDLSLLAYTKYADAVSPITSTALTRFSERFGKLLQDTLKPPLTLILRDYHADNLLWMPERPGAQRVGLLDFQDAMIGHPSYDLVSLLQDVRRDVSPEIARAMISHYVERTKTDRATFETAYHIMGAQRALRILGVFARLSLELDKPSYIDMIPKTWHVLTSNLKHPALAPVADLLFETLPFPDKQVLRSLKNP